MALYRERRIPENAVRLLSGVSDEALDRPVRSIGVVGAWLEHRIDLGAVVLALGLDVGFRIGFAQRS
jgi:hypothetical protein